MSAELNRIVRQDPTVGLTTLFRPLAKGARPKLDVSYTPKDKSLVLQFRGPDALGIEEQTLLLVLQELAQRYQMPLTPSSQHPAEVKLREALFRGTVGKVPDTLHFATTWLELLSLSGIKHGGTTQKTLEAQLRRLCECVVWEHYPGTKTVFQSFLVAMVRGDDKRVHVALNIRLAEAICEAHYMPVSLAERLHLESPGARALHAFFSVWMRPGEARRAYLGTLVERLWPLAAFGASSAPQPIPKSTVRRRLSDARNFLGEIDSLEGWTVTLDRAKALAEIKRVASGAGSPGAATPARDMTGARDMTRHIASDNASLRERPVVRKASNDAGFLTVDASALFLTT